MNDASARRRRPLAAAALGALHPALVRDVGAAWRPAGPRRVPPRVLLAAFLAALGVWLRGRWTTRTGRARSGRWQAGWRCVMALAFFFRLADRLERRRRGRDGGRSPVRNRRAARRCTAVEHLVFVPQVPHSGSLKSHLTALARDGDRAARAPSRFASVLFYRRVRRRPLPARAPGAGAAGGASCAGLYAAFSPAFVTRYSLSNDGNYVEVLALGTWALWLAARADARAGGATASRPPGGPAARPRLLVPHPGGHPPRGARPAVRRGRPRLGLAAAPRSSPRASRLGYAPGWLWNLAQRLGLVPLPAARSGARHRHRRSGRGLGLGLRREALADARRPRSGLDGLRHRLRPRRRSRALLVLAWLGVGMAMLPRRRRRDAPYARRSGRSPRLLLFAASERSAWCWWRCRTLPGNPAHLLFLMSVIRCSGDALRPGGPVRAARTRSRRPDRHRSRRFARPAAADARPGRAGAGSWRSSSATASVIATPTSSSPARINFLSAGASCARPSSGPSRPSASSPTGRRRACARGCAHPGEPDGRGARLEKRLGELGVSFERAHLREAGAVRPLAQVDLGSSSGADEFPIHAMSPAQRARILVDNSASAPTFRSCGEIACFGDW